MASTGVSHAREEDVPHFSNHPIEKPGTGQACRVNLRRPGAAHTPTTHTHDAGVPGRNEKESMLAQPVKGHTSSSVTLQPLLLDKDLMYETRLLPLQPHAEDRLLRDGERLPLIRFSGARIYLGEPVATEATEVLEP